MTQDNILSETTDLLREPFALDAKVENVVDEEALLNMLAARIGHMLETEPEYLMSLLYRLDVLESKIRPVMHPGAVEPANVGLARLVLERQKQRVETKKNVKTKPIEGMDDWEW